MTTPSQPTPPVPPTPPSTPGNGTTPTPGTPASSTVSGSAVLDTVAQGVIGAAKTARQQVGRLTQANRGTITSALDKIGQTVDRQTGARWHQQIENAKSWAVKGVDVVAGGAPASTPGTSSPATSTPRTAAPTTSPATPSAPPAPPAAPAEPKEGWHRGPDGQWVKNA